MTTTHRLSVVGTAAVLALTALQAQATDILYISSASGWVLGGVAGGRAVTEGWSGQPPINGFTGYSQIQWMGKCLTSPPSNAKAGLQLTWEACKNPRQPTQTWSLANKKLNNESGWCADVQGNDSRVNVPVVAWTCSGSGNQRWNAHFKETAQAAVASIPNNAVRAQFVQTAANARPGQLISTLTGQVISNDGATIIGQDGSGLRSLGQGNVVSNGK